MAQPLHFAFSSELVDPPRHECRDRGAIDMAEVFPDCASASRAWKGLAQATVDNSHLRCFIAHSRRRRDEETEAGPIQELG